MLKLLIENEIGDINERNKLGLLPQEIEHDNHYQYVPKEISHHFKEDLQETLEGDYLIITSESDTCKGRKQLLLEQLKDLQLEEHTETFEVTADDKNDPTKKLILISI